MIAFIGLQIINLYEFLKFKINALCSLPNTIKKNQDDVETPDESQVFIQSTMIVIKYIKDKIWPYHLRCL